MHYVTEEELRRAWGEGPFERYTLKPGDRLTPSARQFLVDFRVGLDGFDAGAAPGHGEAAGPAGTGPDGADGSPSVAVAGARCRLAARRALGVDNACSRVLDEVGSAWMGGAAVSVPPCDGAVMAPLPLDGAVNPLFFELDLLRLQLEAAAPRWERAGLGRRAQEARALAAHLVAACARAGEEAAHV